MTEGKQAITKADLVARLRSSGQQAVDNLRALSPATLEQGRYESGWNGRQILAHIASIEWTYPRLIGIARDAQTPAAPEAGAASAPAPRSATDVPTRPFTGGVNDYNERQVQKRAEATVADLIAEFETNRVATIAAVEQADEALFAITIRSAGGITGPLADVINAIAVLHVQGHVNDIAGPPSRG